MYTIDKLCDKVLYVFVSEKIIDSFALQNNWRASAIVYGVGIPKMPSFNIVGPSFNIVGLVGYVFNHSRFLIIRIPTSLGNIILGEYFTLLNMIPFKSRYFLGHKKIYYYSWINR